jgi:hypothetical protein
MSAATPWDDLQRVLMSGSDDPGENMSDEVDPNGPWWKAGRLPPLDSHYSTSWAGIGLAIQALHGGKGYTEKNHTGSIKDGDSLAEFLKRFADAFPTLRQLKFDKAQHKASETQIQYVVDHGAVSIDHDGDVKTEMHAVSRDLEFLEAVSRFFAENTTTSIPKGRVHVLITTSTGPEFKSMGVGGQKLERGNYEDDVLAGYDRIVRDLQAATPAGRVAILDGKPGTGKTFLVRGILDDVKDVIFVIVPANLIQELAQPGMIPALVGLHQSRGDKPMVFIIEDADEVLAPRAGDNMSSVSAILNLGDGILGQLLDVRIVATTNAHRQDVDEAIKRPGRLSAMVHVGPLGAEKAGEVYTRLTGKPARIYPDMSNPLESTSMFKGKTSLAEVYQICRDSGWTPAPKERKLGFSTNEEDDDYDY